MNHTKANDKTEPTLQEQLIEALEGSDTFVLGNPYESEYMERLVTLIEKAERKARLDELEWLQNKHKEETNDGWNEPPTPLITYVVIRKHIIKKESE